MVMPGRIAVGIIARDTARFAQAQLERPHCRLSPIASRLCGRGGNAPAPGLQGVGKCRREGSRQLGVGAHAMNAYVTALKVDMLDNQFIGANV